MTSGTISQQTFAATQAPAALAGMDILVVSHGFQKNYERGFCNGLVSVGAKVTLISSDQTDYLGLQTSVRTVNLRGSQLASRSKLAKLINLLRYHFLLCLHALIRRPTALHVIGLIDPPFLIGVLEGFWLRLASRRYVMTVHDLLPHDRHTFRNRIAYALSFRLPHRLIVHTQRMRDDLMRIYRISSKRIVVMEHGIEPMSSEVADAPLGSGPVLRLLFFGHIARYKGLDILLEAVNELDLPFSLAISGFCRDAALMRDLRERIRLHPVSSSIAWQNEYIAEDAVGPLFANADMLVLPYRHIDQSGVLFQALRFGLPVVVTRVGALQDYVTPEFGEVCAPNDANDLRAAIRRLSKRLSTMSRRGIARLGKRFEWPQTVQTLRAAYS